MRAALTVAVRAQRKALSGTTTDPRAELQSLVAGTTFDRAKAKSLPSRPKARKSSPRWPTSTTA
jgi:Spy/CpxP family protein refolding chaperone